ncbi:PKD domain-containing protein [Croceivirga thetidis]|uniref:PKD domain-containing protein n=1 Tax=Croceivirga thetidis TaxID=2721623 RepID=A0ABX1GSL9_9FLAO|nr:PKD domain-containing protein [Croceivirga thetidis]NKI32005.1 PKD domain-containing protein [Croceivirga thetidis]
MENKFSYRKVAVHLTLLVLFGTTFLSGFNELFFAPGLTDPEPIGQYANGVFPNLGFTEDPYEPAFENLTFDSPLNFTIVPGQNKIIIGQRDGEIYWFDNLETTTTKNLLVDLSTEVGVVWDGGFLGLAIHPDFGTAGSNYFYVYYTSKSETGDDFLNSPAGQNFSCNLGNEEDEFFGNFLRLERFEVNPADLSFVANSMETMFKLRMYRTTHRGGGLEFGDDGFLYLTTGEQSVKAHAQDITDNLDGGVLRIDVDKDPTKSHAPIRTMQNSAGEADEFSGIEYWIPNDNPFQSPDGSNFEEYYTLGHRNPHRMTKDRQTGVFYIGEIGEATHEEINIVTAGSNYGWPVYEATAGPNLGCVPGLLNGMDHEEPLVEFPRTDANAIIGGYVYRGSDIPDLVGKYICADYGTGDEIWSVDTVTGEYQLLGNFAPTDIISFGQNYDGELYLLKQGAGVGLYRLSNSGAPDYSSMPQLLSDTGAFDDLSTMDVADGFIPYELIDPFWSDGAYKKRWMAVPNDGTHDTPGERITYSENGIWDFPEGSVLIKHFDYPIDDNDPTVTRKIETRFSIKANDGNFYYLTYNWNEAQTDAVLQEIGLDETIDVTTVGGGTRQVTWHYPSNGECLSCHSPATKGTLGLRTRYLNSDYTYDKTGVTGNQMETLSFLGIIEETITDADTPNFLTHTSIDDPTGSTEDKARSYLDLNCAYCHQPATGNRADFDLRLINSMAETGLLTAGINTPLGLAPDEEILFPGDASKSILYHRTNSTDPTIMMPPLAKNEIDVAGVALLEQWINEMDALNQPPPEDTYRIVNLGTGQTMEVVGAGTANGTNVAQAGYAAADNQHFALEEVSTDVYSFRAIHSDGYLDVQAANPDPGANVWHFAGNGSAAQLWQLVDAGDDTFHIISTLGGNYLAVEGGGNIAVLAADGSDEQRWQFLPTGTPSGAGITPEPGIVSTSETGTNDSFTVVLDVAPTSDVVLNLTETLNGDEFDISETSLTFTSADWNQPQTVIVTGLDDVDADGVQYYEITLSVAAGSDSAYLGFSAVVDGFNADDDGGAAAPPDLDTYRILNTGTGQTMEVVGSGTANQTNVAQAGYTATDNQHFALEYDGGGYYKLRAEHSGSYLDVQAASSASGTNVWQFAGNTSDAQLWQIVDAGGNTFHIISKLGTNYLTVEPDGNIAVYTADGSDEQRWQFLPTGTPTGAGITAEPGIVSTSEDGTTDSFTIVLDAAPSSNVILQITESSNGDEFDISRNVLTFTPADWNVPQAVGVIGLDDTDLDGVQYYDITVTVDPTSDPIYLGFSTIVDGFNADDDGGAASPPALATYRIINRGTGQSMEVVGSGLADQTNVAEATYIESDNQHFALEYDGQGYYKFRAEHSGSYLDVQAASPDSGTNVWQFTGNTSDAQLWQIVDAGDNTFHVISKVGGNYLAVEPDGNIAVYTADGSDEQRWQFKFPGFDPTAVAISDITEGDAPLLVNFTGDQSTDDVGIASYSWDFGDGVGTSTDANPSYTFTGAGTYTVVLTVTDDGGLTDTAEIEITVTVANGAPTAVASSDVTEGEAPLLVNFTGDQSTDDVGIASYSWDFGDGIGTSTDANPSYTFTGAGTYTVVLTVTDDGGLTDSAQIEISVTAANGSPIALAIADVTEGDAPLLVNFTGDQSTDDVGIANYSWDFGDGVGTSTDANPSYTFTAAGTYTVVLTVTDDGGLTDTDELTITVTTANNAPTAVATSDVTEGDAPLLVNFTGDQSTDDVGIASYSWDFGDGAGTSTDANPSYTYTATGTYTAVLTVTDANGLTDTAQIEITVNAANGAPTAVASSDVSEGDAPLLVNFTGDQSTDDVGIASYSWDFGDGAGTSTDANPSYTYTAAGTYTAVLTVTDADGLTDTAQIEITVNSANGAPTAVASSDVTEGEAPLLVNFTGDQSTDDVGIASYSWDFGDGVGTSTDANPSYTYTTAGTYTAVLTVTDADGLTDTAQIEITVNSANGAPTAVASSDVTEGEAPLLVNFTGDQSTDDVGIASYSWDFGDGVGTSTDAKPSYTYTAAGTYTAVLTVTDADGLTDTAQIEITVNAANGAPTAVASSDIDSGEAPLLVNFTGDQSTDDTGIASYSWDFGDGVGTSTDANPSYTFTDPGSYIVTLTVSDVEGLSDDTSLAIEVLENQVSDLEPDPFIAPNPASNVANLYVGNLSNDRTITQFKLFDSSGKLLGVFEPSQLFVSEGQYGIPVYNLRDELYFIVIELNTGEPLLRRILVSN